MPHEAGARVCACVRLQVASEFDYDRICAKRRTGQIHCHPTQSIAQIPLGSTRVDTFDVSSESSSSCRVCRSVLFDKLDTAKMHGLDTSNVSSRVESRRDEPSGIWADAHDEIREGIRGLRVKDVVSCSHRYATAGLRNVRAWPPLFSGPHTCAPKNI